MTRSLLIGLFIAAVPASAQTLDFDTARGAREVAMGGTFREMGTTANAVDGNPAAMGLFPAFQLDFAAGWDPRSHGWYAAGWARDSTNPDISAGYSLHYLSNETNGDAVGQWAHSLSLATRLGDRVAIGLGTRWLIQSQPHINAASLNAGLAIRAANTLTLGFAAYNLIDTHHPELSRAFEVGFSWLLGPVRLASEVRSDLGRGPVHPIVNAGTEFLLSRAFALRAGYEWQQATSNNFLSGGIGFLVDNAGFDFAYRHGFNQPSRLLVVSFRLQLQ